MEAPSILPRTKKKPWNSHLKGFHHLYLTYFTLKY